MPMTSPSQWANHGYIYIVTINMDCINRLMINLHYGQTSAHIVKSET